ncbi:MAG TPA: oligosaccharide flippase family protein [Acidobacteriota bacterium]|nr:oligosaccharide flippase family protein [Acidobacteriota bacterium]
MTSRALYLSNVSTSYLQIGGRVLVMFFLTPFLLARLGQEQYGIWVLLASILAYFEFSDFGFTTTLARELPQRRARGDQEGISATISSIFFAFLILLAILTPIAWGLSHLLGGVFRVDPGQVETARTTFLLVFGAFVVGFEKRVFEAAINATERLYLTHLLAAAYNVAYGVTFYLIAASGGGVRELAIGLLGLSGAGAFASYIVARRALGFTLSARLFDKAIPRRMWSSSVFYFIAGFSTTIILHSDNLVLSAFLGASTVAVYAVAYRFVDLFRVLVGRLVDVIFPQVAAASALGDGTQLRSLAVRFVGLSALAAGAIGTVLYFLGYAVLGWWIGADNLIGRDVYNVFIVYFILHSLTHASGLFIGAMGIHKPIALVGIGEASANIVLSLILIGPLGPLGVALATVVAHVGGTGWFAHFHLCRALWGRRAIAIAGAPATAGISPEAVLESRVQ